MTQIWIPRVLEPLLARQLKRSKSILLLGPRQTGKTSLLSRFNLDFSISFLLSRTRLAYEKDPDRLIGEVEALRKELPLILIDEAQKVPAILDVVQYLADEKKAQFVITGSSARKFKIRDPVNLLPGRVVQMRLDPLCLEELEKPKLEDLLLFGSLPGIHLEKSAQNKEMDLATYVETFLEEEVRKEALVRNVPAFSRFLELAAIDSGRISNLSEISKQVGVAHTTIASHYQILEDCLVVERFDPIFESASRRKLTKSPRYLFFDLGVRRLAANEGTRLRPERMGELLEHWVGLEARRLCRLYWGPQGSVRFWRDPDGPEVDWVLEREGEWIPLEVKWTRDPGRLSTRHLETFMEEYRSRCRSAYVICRAPRPQKLRANITALPWDHLSEIFFHTSPGSKAPRNRSFRLTLKQA